MIINYNRSASPEMMLQSLMESTQMALDNIERQINSIEITEGDTYTVKFSDLTDAQKQQLKGDRGEIGPQGPRGEKGEDGIMIPLNSFFTLAGDEDGNLWAYYNDDNAPQFDVDANGNIYYITPDA